MAKSGGRIQVDNTPELEVDAFTQSVVPVSAPWPPGRKYENFGFVRTVLDLVAALSLVGGVGGALLAFLQSPRSDPVTAAISCISGVFIAALLGGLSIALVILRDIAHDQRRAALEARRTANAMERIANRQRSN